MENSLKNILLNQKPFLLLAGVVLLLLAIQMIFLSLMGLVITIAYFMVPISLVLISLFTLRFFLRQLAEDKRRTLTMSVYDIVAGLFSVSLFVLLPVSILIKYFAVALFVVFCAVRAMYVSRQDNAHIQTSRVSVGYSVAMYLGMVGIFSIYEISHENILFILLYVFVYISTYFAVILYLKRGIHSFFPMSLLTGVIAVELFSSLVFAVTIPLVFKVLLFVLMLYVLEKYLIDGIIPQTSNIDT
ncbi:MAG: hypothetical protein WC045_03485 [Patescibacteria group bacterium]